MKEWIDSRVDVKQIENANVTFTYKQKDITCLCFASEYNSTRTVQQLIQAGADVTATDSRGNIPLHWAAGCKNEPNQKVVYLLSCDASLIRARNNDNDTPLHRAARNGNDTVINVLIQHGAAVHERGQFGRTAP